MKYCLHAEARLECREGVEGPDFSGKSSFVLWGFRPVARSTVAVHDPEQGAVRSSVLISRWAMSRYRIGGRFALAGSTGGMPVSDRESPVHCPIGRAVGHAVRACIVLQPHFAGSVSVTCGDVNDLYFLDVVAPL